MKLTENKSQAMEQAKQTFLARLPQQLLEATEVWKALPAEAEAAITKVYLFAHTVKGSGGTLGVWEVAEPAAEVAAILRLVRDYGGELTLAVQQFVSDCLEVIRQECSMSDSPCEVIFSNEDDLSPGSHRILVVDDDPAITHLVSGSLREKGYETEECHDLNSAVRSIEGATPDLIILDVILPEGDGLELCRLMRSERRWENIPIIFLTVKNQLADKMVAFTTGADDYLPKPFAVRELVARVEAILHRLEAYRELGLRDELTQLHNRRYIRQYIDRAVATREPVGFSLAMIDIDRFKLINDCHGHSAGDLVLCEVAGRLSQGLRTSDVIGRYGGEEFVVVLPRTSAAAGLLIMDRIRESIAEYPICLPGRDLQIPLTVSIGLVEYPSDGVSSCALLEAADEAMYLAKRQGRNRAVNRLGSANC